MNPQLTTRQQNVICSSIGSVKLKLLYKASIHGFTGAAFHQKCDNISPTLAVGYNDSGHVFGGYTTQRFNQSGQYVADNAAFLFSFKEKFLKYPVTTPEYALRMVNNSGPYFGEALILVNGNKPVAYSAPGNYYNFNAAQMHGNNLNLKECEVYQVEKAAELEKPWRTIVWNSETRTELIEYIKAYKPPITSVSQVRVLLIGPVGAGKSSFFNSINSVFRGHVTSRAISGCSATSLTTQFRSYSLKSYCDGKPLPIVLCDTMGMEDGVGAGLDMDDISSIVKGHLPDFYQFNPAAPMSPEASDCKSPELKDKIHCVVYVIDASTIAIMPTSFEEKLNVIHRKVNLIGIPQLVLLTHVDEACPLVNEDVTNIYKSGYIKDVMQEVNSRIGVPVSCIVPVKNYFEELELDANVDILLLGAVRQMLRIADDYFENVTDRLSSLETKE